MQAGYTVAVKQSGSMINQKLKNNIIISQNISQIFIL